jgi:hypothetical protein
MPGCRFSVTAMFLTVFGDCLYFIKHYNCIWVVLKESQNRIYLKNMFVT